MGNIWATPVRAPVIVPPDPTHHTGDNYVIRQPIQQNRPAGPSRARATRPSCRYYARSACHRGAACRFSHDEAALDTRTTPPGLQSPKPCRYFQRGHCIKGDACLFSHDSDARSNGVRRWTRELAGAWVEFGAGTVPTKITMPMDFSSIKISNIRKECSVDLIIRMLANVGIKIPRNAVQLTKIPSAQEYFAFVTLEDPTFARTACRKLNTCIAITTQGIMISPRLVPGPRGSSMHQIDSRQVDVSWDRPTKTAWVSFANHATAVGVHKRLSMGRYRIRQRKIDTVTMLPKKIVIPGLPLTVNEEDVSKDFRDEERPCVITFGEPSYEYDIEIQSTLIESMLDEFGPLESWEVADDPQRPRVTARATFVDESSAGNASSSLNGSKLPYFDEGQLSVQHSIVVKLKVLCRVYDAVQEQVGALVGTWRANGVTYIAYAPQGSHRNIRLKGANRSNVAKAQQQLQFAIRGHTINIAELTPPSTIPGQVPISSTTSLQVQVSTTTL